MTHAERRAIEAAVATWAAPPVLTWRPHADSRFVALAAGPCPLLEPGEPATCRVWPVRPYNCRRWGCFREDVRVEPLEPDDSVFGFRNLHVRFERDRNVRRQLALLQRRAQRWARQHGWTPD